MKVKRNYCVAWSLVVPIRKCHFCGKPIRFLHKYIELEPGYFYYYQAHINCTMYWIFTQNPDMDNEWLSIKWGPRKEK